jgi:hypothetical protein
MRRLLIAAAVMGTVISSVVPAKAYPFKMDVDSIAYWLSNLRYSNDPTFRKRIHSLYDCKHNQTPWSGEYVGYITCHGYIDISDGTYPNGTRCEMTVDMWYDSQTAIRDEVTINFENKYCYKGNQSLDWK